MAPRLGCHAGWVCLAFLRFQPDDEWPVLLVSIRDEDLARPADRPGTWWPDNHPGVLGGRDRRAGGTWLAVDAQRREVAAVFTPGAESPPVVGQRTRGELPLVTIRDGDLGGAHLAAYQPFTLLLAGADHAEWWTWTGSQLDRTTVQPGTHIANIDGLDADAESPRQARWRAPFADTAPVPFRPDAAPSQRWGGWRDLLGHGLEPERPDSLVLRRTHNGGTYGTRSVALLAIGQHDLRYDETDRPWDAQSWVTVV